jgi:hypothetical protein
MGDSGAATFPTVEKPLRRGWGIVGRRASPCQTWVTFGDRNCDRHLVQALLGVQAAKHEGKGESCGRPGSPLGRS